MLGIFLRIINEEIDKAKEQKNSETV